MMKIFIRVFLGSLIGISFAAAVSAQDGWMGDIRDKYVISAKAGGVNFVEGTVTVAGENGRSGRLFKGDQLDTGDRVATGSDGKAEILLNPGSYTRLGGNSSFEFATTSLDDLELKLGSGSAIFEVFASKDFKVTINTPRAKMFLIQSGIYRVDVLTDGSGRVSVIKGRVQLGDNALTVVKSGGQATLNGRASQLAKFDSDDKDQLDTWSKLRAKELARISRKVEETSMRMSLLNSFREQRWHMFGSFGLWAYDPFWGSYSFLPFGYGWNSPYGYGFGPCIYAYNLPPVVYMPPANSGGAGTQNPSNAPNPRGPGGIKPVIPVTPPFAVIQSDPKSGSSITNGGGGRSITNTKTDGTPAPVFLPPPPDPVIVPTTTRSGSKPKGN